MFVMDFDPLDKLDFFVLGDCNTTTSAMNRIFHGEVTATFNLQQAEFSTGRCGTTTG